MPSWFFVYSLIYRSGYKKFIVHLKLILSLVVDVEHSHVRFLGNLVLNLWDCGG